MDDEGVDNFNVRLEQIQYEAEASRNRHKMRQQRATATAAGRDMPPQPEGKVTWNGWVKPEGWTPPGWNEEKSMQAAKSFMGFKSNPK